MIRYLIIHNKHEGCYDFHCYQDEVARIRLTSITINPPKIYMFTTRDEAQDFFEEYINDVDCIDIRCKKGDEVEHIDYCTCGVIELDDKGEPILFYNKKNQIFLMEHGPQLFVPNHELKNDVKNLNLTNRLIRKCKSLGREQRKRYIELGKYCEGCNAEDSSDDEEDTNKVIKTESEIKSESLKNKDEEEDTAPEFKVLKSIPPEGISVDALNYKLGEDAKIGLCICLKNKWVYKNDNLIMRATSESFNNEEPKKEESKKEESKKEESKKEESKKEESKKEESKPAEKTKKPKTVRKKKTDTEETNTDESKPVEKKQRAPRKKKTDTA
jgi:hypothetical protein